MRILYLLISFFLGAEVCMAAERSTIPAKLTVKIELNQQQEKQGKLSEHHQLSNSLQMTVANPDWMTVARQQTHSGNDLFLVLSKLEKANSKTAKFKFLIVNLEKKNETISEPEIAVHYGQQGQIEFELNKQKLQLSVLATKEDVS